MPSFTQAARSDRETLLALMREFYTGESLAFTPQVAAAMDQLLDGDQLGLIYLIHAETANLGYFVLTFAHSLERGGRIAILDELYVVLAARGKGLGKAAIAWATDVARKSNCRTLLLEVDQKNTAAQHLYRAADFVQLDRHLLFLPL
jgi:GNAT superfamily N-acetyltransferase